MGVRYEFGCQSCDLKSEVCGNDSSGMQFECTTVWCCDCQSLSDATTSEIYSTRDVVCPDQPCPQCQEKALELWQQGTCPRCSKQMVMDSEKDEDGKWQITSFCFDCDYKTRFTGMPGIEENDTVDQAIVCRNCNDIVFVTSHQPGIWAKYSTWTDYELRCENCRSGNVNRWSAGQPCPACGGKFIRSTDSVTFFD